MSAVAVRAVVSGKRTTVQQAARSQGKEETSTRFSPIVDARLVLGKSQKPLELSTIVQSVRYSLIVGSPVCSEKMRPWLLEQPRHHDHCFGTVAFGNHHHVVTTTTGQRADKLCRRSQLPWHLGREKNCEVACNPSIQRGEALVVALAPHLDGASTT